MKYIISQIIRQWMFTLTHTNNIFQINEVEFKAEKARAPKREWDKELFIQVIYHIEMLINVYIFSEFFEQKLPFFQENRTDFSPKNDLSQNWNLLNWTYIELFFYFVHASVELTERLEEKPTRKIDQMFKWFQIYKIERWHVYF